MRSFTTHSLRLFHRTRTLPEASGIGPGEGGNYRNSKPQHLHTLGAQFPQSYQASANSMPFYLVPALFSGCFPSHSQKRNVGSFFRPSLFAEQQNRAELQPTQEGSVASRDITALNLGHTGLSPRLPTLQLTRHPLMVPGYDVMVQLVVYLDDCVGACPKEQNLVVAFHELIGYYLNQDGKVKGDKMLEEHSYVLMRAYEYLYGLGQSRRKLEDDTGQRDITVPTRYEISISPLSLQTLQNTISILHITPPRNPSSVHFSRLLFADLMARNDISISTLRDMLHITQFSFTLSGQQLALSIFKDIISHPEYEPIPNDYLCITRALSNMCLDPPLDTDPYDEALDLCTAAWIKYATRAVTTKVWEEVLRSYARRGDEERFQKAWGLIVDKYHMKPDSGMWHQRVAVHCAVEDGLDAAQKWWDQLRTRPNGVEPALETYEVLLRSYARKDKTYKADDLLWYMLTLHEEREPDLGSQLGELEAKHWWAMVARWACKLGLRMKAAGIKPGLDSIDFIFKRMVKANKKGASWIPLPDADIMNELVENLIRRKKWNIAENAINMADHWGIRPNRKLLSLKAEILVQKGDLEEALKTYEMMNIYDIPKEDKAVELRKLIRAFCGVGTGLDEGGKIPQGTPHTQLTPIPLSKVQYLLSVFYDRRLVIDANTMSSVIVYHLSTNTLSEIPPLLQRTIHDLPISSLNWLVTLFLAHIKSPRTSLLSAWDSYLILQTYFPPSTITPPIRITLMQIFFSLGRSDMAITVMSQSSTPSAIPLSMYITALHGVTLYKDLENLRLVHNLINLSPEIPIPTPTELLNALMNAYSHCELYDRAMRFWGTIKRSRAGPDHTSISIVLDMCGRRKGWLGEAKSIWRKLKNLKIKPTTGNYASYVEAHARHGMFKEAWEIVKSMQGEGGGSPDEKVYVISPIYRFVSSMKNVANFFKKISCFSCYSSVAGCRHYIIVSHRIEGKKLQNGPRKPILMCGFLGSKRA